MIFTQRHYAVRTIFRSLLSPDFFDPLFQGENPVINATASLLQILSALFVIV